MPLRVSGRLPPMLPVKQQSFPQPLLEVSLRSTHTSALPTNHLQYCRARIPFYFYGEPRTSSRSGASELRFTSNFRQLQPTNSLKLIRSHLRLDVVRTRPVRRGYSTKTRDETKPADQDDTDKNRKQRLMGGFSSNFQVLLMCISTLVALNRVNTVEERNSFHTGESRGLNSTGEEAAPATDTDVEQSQGDQEVFNGSKFTSFTIVERVSTNDRVGSQVVRLTVVPTSQSKQLLENPQDASFERGIWAVEFKEAEAGTTRVCIPLPPRPADPPSSRSSL
jgi:hypothetical protein